MIRLRLVFSVLLLIGLSASAADHPNVLFIAIDNLNDWVGPLGGHPQVKTPTLDALAASGTTSANAHCQSPFCNPSRTSFLLSRRPTSRGIYALNASFRTIDELAGEKPVPGSVKKMVSRRNGRWHYEDTLIEN